MGQQLAVLHPSVGTAWLILHLSVGHAWPVSF